MVSVQKKWHRELQNKKKLFNKERKVENLVLKLKKLKGKILILMCTAYVLLAFNVQRVYAKGDVSGAIEGAWNSAEGQIKSVVNNVVFPVIDLVLAVFFFVKLGTAYFDYRKQGQFEWAAPAILFACLCFTLTAPNYIWNIL